MADEDKQEGDTPEDEDEDLVSHVTSDAGEEGADDDDSDPDLQSVQTFGERRREKK